MRNLIIVFFCSSLHITLAGDPKYPVSAIPEELKADMNAVIREEQLVFKILSKSKAAEYVHKVITIFNQKGKLHAAEVVGYDKLSKIKNIGGSVYDAAGKLIKKLKNSEIVDQSAFDGFSLYSDNRLKHFDLSQGTYPYTVEIEYEIEYKYLFHVPGFFVLPGGRVSSQHASYSLQYPAELTGLEPHYALININEKPKREKTKDGFESLSWTFENVKPIEAEPLGPAERDLMPQIMAAPSEFEYDGYVGVMNSWEQFGQWIGALNSGRNNLSQETKKKMKQITENLKTPEEKIKAIYEYLQNKTRYVSVQLGIGGFQPFEAAVVDEMGYGDCKALSNYMVSMLDAVGIKANYTLIRAGKDALKMNVNFPSSQFNHAVVFVPNHADTIWLECTSQTNPFGYMGTFTGDRRALAITDHGAKIVMTPKYSAEQNVQSRTAEVVVDVKGNARAKIKTTYSGLQYENGNLNFILNDQYDEQKKWIEKTTAIPSFDLNSFTMTTRNERIPSAKVNLDLTLNRLATVSGKRLFLMPNLMNRSTFLPEKVENRKSNVIRKVAYTDLDTIRFHVPEELYPEFLPEPVKVKSRFGGYEASFKLDQGSVVYMRKIIMNKGEFPPESYNELIEFYKSINKADNIKLVFLNKT
ncbi:MAG TPA: DUF3857 domain-containing transglutaminase family protein [Cyclobacteriaceae bacterium]|nr:DUF3857 domain-containing transglutaminase family protein [Cyclobacteriaceae bacterium]